MAESTPANLPGQLHPAASDLVSGAGEPEERVLEAAGHRGHDQPRLE